MKCDKCGQDMPAKETWMIAGYEVTSPVKAEDLVSAQVLCPEEGFRLPKQWELFKIMDKIEDRKKLSNGRWMFFWSATKFEKYTKGVYLDGSLDVSSNYVDFAESNSVGHVLFVREVPNGKN